MEEIYKYYGYYYMRSQRHDIWVSNFGNVKDNGKLKERPTKVMGVRIYNVVARLFIPNPENKPRVDHIDTNRRNNMVDNLRWVTNKENMQNELTRLHCAQAAIKRWANGDYVGSAEKLRGRTPWNKGLKGVGQSMFGRRHSEKTKALMSAAQKGKRKVWDDETHTSYHYVMPYKSL